MAASAASTPRPRPAEKRCHLTALLRGPTDRLPRAVSHLRSINFRRIAFVVAVLALCVSVSACGVSRRKKIYNVTEAEIAAGGEPYFFAGPVTYQIELSRQLNPYATEDVQYLSGLHGAQQIPASDMWFGVFLW